MKRIGLDLRLYGTEHGGIGRYCQQLFPRILELDGQNHYVLFVNSRDVGQFKSQANITIVPTSIRHYSFGEQLSFLRLLNKYNLDLVHFPNFNLPIFYRRPFVVTIHDMVHHKIGGAKKSHFLHFLAYKKVIASAAKNAKSIITVSEISKNDISKILQIPADKIKVIYEAASLSADVGQSQVEEVKNQYLIKRPYFLFVGVLERKKNLVSLTRGFDYFLQKYKVNIDLVIAGKADSHYPDIRHKAMDIKHQDHLVFTGQVSDLELTALYKGALAFASASLHEGFGLPGLEAMSFGLPLIVSNIPVFNEIYDNSAIYFDPLKPADIAEKMNLLIRDSQFNKQIQQNSFKRGQMFSWEKTAQETLGVYRQCLDDKMIV